MAVPQRLESIFLFGLSTDRALGNRIAGNAGVLVHAEMLFGVQF